MIFILLSKNLSNKDFDYENNQQINIFGYYFMMEFNLYINLLLGIIKNPELYKYPLLGLYPLFQGWWIML